MVSKSKLKYIKSLQVKKYRNQEQSFVVEGWKGVEDLLRSDFTVTLLCATRAYLDDHSDLIRRKAGESLLVTPAELEAAGSFQSNRDVLAVATMKPNKHFQVKRDEYALLLDDIRDPGNLGTIIRTADWYGIRKVIASEETADLYNPKVISATMGSFARVNVYYGPIAEFATSHDLPVYGTFLDGTNVHDVAFQAGGLLVVGNEAHGISKKVEAVVTERVTIPGFGGAESLNAAVATGVILDNLRSRPGTGLKRSC